jgi:hypothetical protein
VLLAILSHLVDDPRSLARDGAVGRAWWEAAAASGASLWEQASASIPLLDILQEEYSIQAWTRTTSTTMTMKIPTKGASLSERSTCSTWPASACCSS